MNSEKEAKTNPRPWESVLPTGPILRPAEAAAYIGLSLTTYYDQSNRGLLPKPLKIAERATGVPRPWLDAVIAERMLIARGAVH